MFIGLDHSDGGDNEREGDKRRDGEESDKRRESEHVHGHSPSTRSSIHSPKASLYQIDPSGSYRSVNVVASGVGYEDARKFLGRRLEELDDNIANCILALKEFSGKNISPEDVSMGVLREGEFKVFSQMEIEEVFDSIKI